MMPDFIDDESDDIPGAVLFVAIISALLVLFALGACGVEWWR